MPSVNSLRAFVAAARHSSFKIAARELHVTPAAISHQVKRLEAELGIQLFRRYPNRLELTTLGARFLPGLERGFEHLATSVDELRLSTRHNRLDVSVAPSFAAKWLLPRLHSFIESHPDIDVHITAAENLIDRNSADGGQPATDATQDNQQRVAIAFGRGDYPGYRVDELFSTSLALFCAPQLLRGAYPLRSPVDLQHHTLLHDDTPFFTGDPSSWNVWFEHASPGAPDVSRRLHFSHATLALDAAIDGLGIALSPTPLALLDVTAGRLVVPFGPIINSDSGYYLLTPTGDVEPSRVALFRAWILLEARNDGVRLAALQQKQLSP